jgi:hypothetical protein
LDTKLTGGAALRRIISLLITVAFIGMLGLGYYGCSDAGESGEVEDSFRPDLSNARLAERLGSDDGFALAVMYGADLHGSLETCG